MASTNFPVFVPALQGRVVSRLSESTPTPVITPLPPPTPIPPTPVNIGPALSAFWQDRLDTLATERDELATSRAQLQELHAMGLSVTGIGNRIDKISVPTEFTVTTKMSAADTALATRGVEATERLAENTKPPPPDTCAVREEMSDLAFTIVARLTTLAARLMDRNDVTLDSVISKLKDAENQQLIVEIDKLLSDIQATAAATLLQRAVNVQPFLQWATEQLPQHDPKLYAELNRRAALLLAAKCLVATKVVGTASDWPPPGSSTVTSSPAFKSRKGAA
jgi:hypothetical protein